MDAVDDRMVEILWAFYQHREDGTPQTVALFLGWDIHDPVFRYNLYKLDEVGAIELMDMPAFGNLGPPEVYTVTPKGEQILREWGYSVDR